MYINRVMDDFIDRLAEKDRLKQDTKKEIYKALTAAGIADRNPEREIYINSQDRKYKVNIRLEEI